MFRKMMLALCMIPLLALPVMGQDAVQTAVNPLDQAINVDFPGGTLPALLEAVERENGIKPNVIVSKEAAQALLPPISLRDATVNDMLTAIARLEVISDTVIQVSRSSDSVITVLAKPIAGLPRPADKLSRVFNVKHLITGGEYGIDDIVTTIETAWALRSDIHSARVMYHEETGLLIAMGTRDELNTVENVLIELEKAKAEAREKTIAEAVDERLHAITEAIVDLQKENKEMRERLAKLSVKD